MKEIVRRGGPYRRLYDEADWPTRIAALAPAERSKALLEGLRLVDRALVEGDRAVAHELTFALAGVLDLEVTEMPGAMPYFLLDLRRAVRGPRRWACATLEEVIERVQALAEYEVWAFSRELRPDLVRQPTP